MKCDCEAEAEAEYFSKDFEWEDLKAEVEGNPCFAHHLLPFEPSLPSPSIIDTTEADVDAWKRFHTRHSSGKFFKERRYLLKEFPELVSCAQNSKLLEVGCGNGSTVLPVLRGNKNVIVYACDCCDETLERAKEIIGATKLASLHNRFHTFCCDLSTNGFPNWLVCDPCQVKFLIKESNNLSGFCFHRFATYVCYFSVLLASYKSETWCLCFVLDVKEDNATQVTNLHSSDGCNSCIGGVEFVTLIFTLSAVPLERMPRFIKECFNVLKPGGLILFRDYGLYDMTMLRFEPDKRVGYREYMRSDGTRSYFFCLDTVRDLFVRVGFSELELDYCCVKSENRRKGKRMRRVWVHGKFQKPAWS